MREAAARDVVYDDLDRHLPLAGSIDRAAVPMGMYMAWCANHQLLSDALQDQASNLVLRIRFREATGSELAVAGCGGVLRPEHFSREGRSFTEARYADYLADYRMVFGDELYAVKDDWDHYDRIAPVLTRRLMSYRNAGSTDGGRSWWKFWR
jgi:hypothetical protein